MLIFSLEAISHVFNFDRLHHIFLRKTLYQSKQIFFTYPEKITLLLYNDYLHLCLFQNIYYRQGQVRKFSLDAQVKVKKIPPLQGLHHYME